MVKKLPAMQKTRVRFLGQEDTLGKGMATHSSILFFFFPLQHSYLENPMDKGAWWVTVHGVAKSRTQLSDSHFALSLLMHDTGKRLTEQDGWVDGWMNR